MYEEFYGFTDRPFQLTPDPRFYFESGTHRKAMSYLGYGLAQGEGFIVITGEIGAGKTTLVGHLMETIDPSRLTAVKLVSTQVQGDDLLRLTARQFGIPTDGMEKAQILVAIETFLREQARAGKRTLLIVDEAQNLHITALEELRMLSNFQLGGQSLLQIFLLGQPEFRDTLFRLPSLEQLRQRVIATHHLDPMDADEVEPYIVHRLGKVGWTGHPQITDHAYHEMYEYSEGVPRRLNVLASRVLLWGAVERLNRIDGTDVRAVIADIAAETMAAKAEATVAPAPVVTPAPAFAPATAAVPVPPPAPAPVVEPVAPPPFAPNAEMTPAPAAPFAPSVASAPAADETPSWPPATGDAGPAPFAGPNAAPTPAFEPTPAGPLAFEPLDMADSPLATKPVRGATTPGFDTIAPFEGTPNAAPFAQPGEPQPTERMPVDAAMPDVTAPLPDPFTPPATSLIGNPVPFPADLPPLPEDGLPIARSLVAGFGRRGMLDGAEPDAVAPMPAFSGSNAPFATPEHDAGDDAEQVEQVEAETVPDTPASVPAADADVSALKDQISALDARIRDQDAAIRRVLDLLIDWAERDPNGAPAPQHRAA